jgi:hypothetical protein
VLAIKYTTKAHSSKLTPQLNSQSDKNGDFWVRERIHICWIPWKLQVAATMIFITLIFNNIPGMIEAGRIALQSTQYEFS